MLTCATCSQEKYTGHLTAAPHASSNASVPCAGYAMQWPCGNCPWECEIHEKDAPHVCLDRTGATICTGAVPPAGFEGGGGGYGGGGATGGW